jgi:hypothetical protein
MAAKIRKGAKEKPKGNNPSMKLPEFQFSIDTRSLQHVLIELNSLVKSNALI